MTLSGQAFWLQRDSAAPLPLPECPCCGRPYPVGEGVFEHAMAVAEKAFSVSRAAIMGRSQHRQLTRARALVVWALRRLGEGLPYQQIGRMLGNRHYSTMVDAHQRAIAARLKDRAFAQACELVVFAVTAEKEMLDERS